MLIVEVVLLLVVGRSVGYVKEKKNTRSKFGETVVSKFRHIGPCIHKKVFR